MKHQITLTEGELDYIMMAIRTCSIKDPDRDGAFNKLWELTRYIVAKAPGEVPYQFNVEATKPKTRLYTYYKVIKSNNNLVRNELLTRRECEKTKGIFEVTQVKVPASTCYYLFGARFSTIFDYDD